jgi:hypothetical protein
MKNTQPIVEQGGWIEVEKADWPKCRKTLILSAILLGAGCAISCLVEVALSTGSSRWHWLISGRWQTMSTAEWLILTPFFLAAVTFLVALVFRFTETQKLRRRWVRNPHVDPKKLY